MLPNRIDVGRYVVIVIGGLAHPHADRRAQEVLAEDQGVVMRALRAFTVLADREVPKLDAILAETFEEALQIVKREPGGAGVAVCQGSETVLFMLAGLVDAPD